MSGFVAYGPEELAEDHTACDSVQLAPVGPVGAALEADPDEVPELELLGPEDVEPEFDGLELDAELRDPPAPAPLEPFAAVEPVDDALLPPEARELEPVPPLPDDGLEVPEPAVDPLLDEQPATAEIVVTMAIEAIRKGRTRTPRPERVSPRERNDNACATARRDCVRTWEASFPVDASFRPHDCGGQR